MRGWALDRIVELDNLRPGVAGAFLRASHERRQVIASFLASERLQSSEMPIHQMSDDERAKVVASADHRSMLSAAYGDPPRGMRGALSRAGAQPHRRRFYLYLFRLLTKAECDAQRITIARLPRVDLTTLRIAHRLPPDLQSPTLVSALKDVATARKVEMLTALMAENGIDRAALANALRRVTSARQLVAVCRRWSLKAVFPEHPVEESANYRPIRTAAELRHVALTYRNCAEHFVSSVLDGRTAFGEFVEHGRKQLVHLRQIEGHWVIEGIFGPSNAAVSREVRASVCQHFAAAGIHPRARRCDREGQWSVLRSLTSHFDFEDDDDDSDM